jgi:hypothetical protein
VAGGWVVVTGGAVVVVDVVVAGGTVGGGWAVVGVAGLLTTGGGNTGVKGGTPPGNVTGGPEPKPNGAEGSSGAVVGPATWPAGTWSPTGPGPADAPGAGEKREAGAGMIGTLDSGPMATVAPWEANGLR